MPQPFAPDISVPAMPPSLQAVCVFHGGVLYAVKELLERDSKLQNTFWSYQGQLKRIAGKAVDQRFVTLAELRNLRVSTSGGEADTSNVEDEARELFKAAAKNRASDIHIRLQERDELAEIKFRCLSDLVPARDFPCEMPIDVGTAMLRAIYASMSDLSSSTYTPNARQDARIKNEHLPEGVQGIRVTTGPAMAGNYMIMRLLYEEGQTHKGSLRKRLFELGFSHAQIDVIRFIIKLQGLIIICGITNSGKTTTIHNILESIYDETPTRNIMTVEDPPEYRIKGAVQVPAALNAKSEEERGEAFTGAIMNTMRCDVNDIMIGEIRDRKSAQLVIKAALSGHRVFTTLHTKRALNIISRLGDLLRSPEMPDPMLELANSNILSGLIYQQLVQTLCPECKVSLATAMTDKALSPPRDVVRRLEKALGDPTINPDICVKGRGCKNCKGEGVVGQTVLAEVIAVDSVMMDLYRKNGLLAAQRHWLEKQKGRTVCQQALDKIAIGILDPIHVEDRIGPLTQDLFNEDGILDVDELRMFGDEDV